MTTAEFEGTPETDGRSGIPLVAARGGDRSADIYAVARGAGVSHQTVSRVVNGHPHVSAGTRDRVLASMTRLHYRRNNAALALATGRSSTLGLLIDPDQYLMSSSFITAMTTAAQRAGYTVIMRSLHGDRRTALAIGMAELSTRGVDGIVVAADGGHRARPGPVETAVPTVIASLDALSLGGSHAVCVDHVAGARLAVRHLLDLGHHRIAHLSGPARSADAAARQRGWEQEMVASNCIATPLIPGDWTSDSGYTAGQRWTEHLRGAHSTLPTAVFAANDTMALGLLRGLFDRGIRVPQDVSVIGFDNMPGSGYLIPGLTTIDHDVIAVGDHCITSLLQHLMSGQPATADVIAPRLIVRGSTSRRDAQQR